jgi:hypothetical protein
MNGALWRGAPTIASGSPESTLGDTRFFRDRLILICQAQRP